MDTTLNNSYYNLRYVLLEVMHSSGNAYLRVQEFPEDLRIGLFNGLRDRIRLLDSELEAPSNGNIAGIMKRQIGDINRYLSRFEQDVMELVRMSPAPSEVYRVNSQGHK